MTATLERHLAAGLVAEAQLMRQTIAARFERLIKLHDEAGPEYSTLVGNAGSPSGEILVDEVDAFVDGVQGFAASIVKHGRVRQSHSALRTLLAITGIGLQSRLTMRGEGCRRLMQYVSEADDLRRLLIEYIEHYSDIHA